MPLWRTIYIKLNRNEGVVILVENNGNLNKNNIPDQYFIIRHNSPGSTKKYINSKKIYMCFKIFFLNIKSDNVMQMYKAFIPQKSLDMGLAHE